MPQQLATSKVFIDASYLRRMAFNIRSRVFLRFVCLCSKGELLLFTTEIARQEVKANVDAVAKEVSEALNKMQKRAPMLGFLSAQVGETQVRDLTHRDIAKGIQGPVDTFFSACKARTLPFREGVASAVFARYFSGRPPFGAGKKKAEFPDAFILEVLLGNAKETHEPFYVISCDKDMASACQNDKDLFHLQSLDQLLGIYHAHKALADHAVAVVDHNCKAIEHSIKEAFEYLGFMASDVDGEIEDVNVRSVMVERVNVLEVKGEKALVSLDISVEFQATAVFDSLDCGYYDREDDVWVSLEQETKDLEQQCDTTASFFLLMTTGNLDEYEVRDIEVNEGRDIYIDVLELPEYD